MNDFNFTLPLGGTDSNFQPSAHEVLEVAQQAASFLAIPALAPTSLEADAAALCVAIWAGQGGELVSAPRPSRVQAVAVSSLGADFAGDMGTCPLRCVAGCGYRWCFLAHDGSLVWLKFKF